MFAGCSSFNCDLPAWDVANATNLTSMFSECDSFNCDVSSWNVANVTDFSDMFFLCTSFNSGNRENVLASW
eukprot:CAMPEP_0194040224 /NCGR_PEP_ID=MMETSP0009_2-20130614/12273_1 /TAXON_ID=210454 /ORGANISM="Grammatophora oceanica, Strain CCMP 410" /LENGTH=70 /DNA_ID=CAMNT_0038683305 /DNA_START=1 /DNA_END=210 /DNA_ORIENTATION=+